MQIQFTNIYIGAGTNVNNMRMKMIIFSLYSVAFSGIVLQVTEGNIPDRITYGLIIFGLTSAVVTQWWWGQKKNDERIKATAEAEKNRAADWKQMHEESIDVVKNNTSFMEKNVASIDGLDATLERIFNKIDSST